MSPMRVRGTIARAFRRNGGSQRAYELRALGLGQCVTAGVPRATAGLVAVHPLVGRRKQLFERAAVDGEAGRSGADGERDANARPRLEGMRAHRVLNL